MNELWLTTQGLASGAVGVAIVITFLSFWFTQSLSLAVI